MKTLKELSEWLADRGYLHYTHNKGEILYRGVGNPYNFDLENVHVREINGGVILSIIKNGE